MDAALNGGFHLAYLIGAGLVAVAIVAALSVLRSGSPARQRTVASGRPTVAARSPRTPTPAEYDRRVPDHLYFTDSDEANALIASDPMALLVGFALDQQVTVQKAFSGPLRPARAARRARRRRRWRSADLEPVFRERPAIHRFPGAMAQRVHDLAVHVRDTYDGDAARVWTDAADGPALRANLPPCPASAR